MKISRNDDEQIFCNREISLGTQSHVTRRSPKGPEKAREKMYSIDRNYVVESGERRGD